MEKNKDTEHMRAWLVASGSMRAIDVREMSDDDVSVAFFKATNNVRFKSS